LPRRWWSLPLVGEEEYEGIGGGALGAPIWVALLLMLSSNASVRSEMIYLGLFTVLSSSSRLGPYPLYTEIVRNMAVGLHALESRWILQQRLWTMAKSWC